MSQMEGPVSFTQKVSRVRVVGTSEAIQRVESAALEIAHGDAHVLIIGERGVGKAVMARFIHERSSRSLQRFAMLKCAGLPDLLVESELFGHTEGSFDGAYRDKPGLLTSAVGGTVFLDDVGTLSTKCRRGCCGFSRRLRPCTSASMRSKSGAMSG